MVAKLRYIDVAGRMFSMLVGLQTVRILLGDELVARGWILPVWINGISIAVFALLALGALVVFGFSGKGEKTANKVNVQDRYRARLANLTRSH
jgi:hypothetical protein